MSKDFSLHYFPLAFIIIFVATVIGTAVWAYCNKHLMHNVIPIVCETGKELPESRLFTFGLCVCSTLLIMMTIIEHHIISIENINTSIKVLNSFSCVVGMVSSLSMAGMGLFSIQDAEIIHNLFSFVFATFGIIYQFTLSALSQLRGKDFHFILWQYSCSGLTVLFSLGIGASYLMTNYQIKLAKLGRTASSSQSREDTDLLLQRDSVQNTYDEQHRKLINQQRATQENYRNLTRLKKIRKKVMKIKNVWALCQYFSLVFMILFYASLVQDFEGLKLVK